MKIESLRHHPDPIVGAGDKFADTPFSLSATQEGRERREPLPDHALGGLFAAVGNHEGKALLLASMKPNTGYNYAGLHKMTHVQGMKVWDSKLAFNWCSGSLAPIGLVTREIIDQEKGIVGYELTEKGSSIGVSLAGHMLALSEKYPEVALLHLFGSAHSNAKNIDTAIEQEDGGVKNRAPLTRLRIFEELVTRDLPIRLEDLCTALENDYPDEYASRARAFSSHLNQLSKAGIVTFQSVKSDTPYVAFMGAEDFPEEPPSPYKGQVALTHVISTIISHTETPLTRQEIYNQLVRNYPRYASHSEKSLLIAITGITGHLVRGNHAKRIGELNYEQQSILTLTEGQQSLLLEVVEIADKLRNLDPEFLAEGREKAKAIVSDQVRFGTLMQKAKEASSHANAKSQVDSAQEVLQFLRTHQGSTISDIQSHFFAQGKRYTSTTIFGYIHVLRNNGAIKEDLVGKQLHFSALEAEPDAKRPENPSKAPRELAISGVSELHVPVDPTLPELEQSGEQVLIFGTEIKNAWNSSNDGQSSIVFVDEHGDSLELDEPGDGLEL